MFRSFLLSVLLTHTVVANNDTEVDVNDTTVELLPTPPPTTRPAGKYNVIKASGISTANQPHDALASIPEYVDAHERFFMRALGFEIYEHNNWMNVDLYDGSRRLRQNGNGRQLSGTHSIKADYTATIPASEAVNHVTDATTLTNIFNEEFGKAEAAVGQTFGAQMDASSIAAFTSSVANGITNAESVTVGGAPTRRRRSVSSTFTPTAAPTLGTASPTSTPTTSQSPTQAPTVAPTVDAGETNTSATPAPTAAAGGDEEASGAVAPTCAAALSVAVVLSASFAMA